MNEITTPDVIDIYNKRRQKKKEKKRKLDVI